MKDQICQLLVHFTTSENPTVANALLNPKFGLLQTLSLLLASNQSGAVDCLCFLSIANLLAEKDT